MKEDHKEVQHICLVAQPPTCCWGSSIPGAAICTGTLWGRRWPFIITVGGPTITPPCIDQKLYLQHLMNPSSVNPRFCLSTWENKLEQERILSSQYPWFKLHSQAQYGHNRLVKGSWLNKQTHLHSQDACTHWLVEDVGTYSLCNHPHNRASSSWSHKYSIWGWPCLRLRWSNTWPTHWSPPHWWTLGSQVSHLRLLHSPIPKHRKAVELNILVCFMIARLVT